MPRPILLGLVGDSAAGKTTITRGLVRVLGDDNVTHVCTDDYHKYDRRQRAERGITPLEPDCNYLDIMTQDLMNLRAGNPIMKPVYQHSDGTFGAPVYVVPKRFTIAEGLLGFHTEEMRDAYDMRVFLAPPENVRRSWKVQRDCSRRGYTTDQVLGELDRREPDSESFIRPQSRYADVVVSFQPDADASRPETMGAELILRDSLPQPDFSGFMGNGDEGLAEFEGDDGTLGVRIPGDLDRDRAEEIEEMIWSRLHFARHLRTQRLGEFTIGTTLHRSESLALVQLLILYHLVNARAAVALGGDGRDVSDTGEIELPDPGAEAGAGAEASEK